MKSFIEYANDLIVKKSATFTPFSKEWYLQKLSSAIEKIEPKNKELLQKWIDALLSGYFKQTYHVLGVLGDGCQYNCVVGVYAEISNKHKSTNGVDIYYDRNKFNVCDNFLTPEFAEVVMTLNDKLKFSFEEIAYVLQHYIPVAD